MKLILTLPNGEIKKIEPYAEESDTQSTEDGNAFLHDFGKHKEKVEEALSSGARITDHRIKL